LAYEYNENKFQKIIVFMNWNRSVSIVTGYRLDDWGSILDRGRALSLCLHVQTGSWTHPAFFTMGIKVSFPEG
jgi:hypothetical protein